MAAQSLHVETHAARPTYIDRVAYARRLRARHPLSPSMTAAIHDRPPCAVLSDRLQMVRLHTRPKPAMRLFCSPTLCARYAQPQESTLGRGARRRRSPADLRAHRAPRLSDRMRQAVGVPATSKGAARWPHEPAAGRPPAQGCPGKRSRGWGSRERSTGERWGVTHVCIAAGPIGPTVCTFRAAGLEPARVPRVWVGAVCVSDVVRVSYTKILIEFDTGHDRARASMCELRPDSGHTTAAARARSRDSHHAP